MKDSICRVILITLIFGGLAAYGQAHEYSIGPSANEQAEDLRVTIDPVHQEDEVLGLIFFNGFETGTCLGWSAIEPAIIANFVFARGGLTVAAEDISLNCPSSWVWEMGDGAILLGSSIMHAYADPGTYEITLTASNVSSSVSISQSVTVE